MKKKINQKLKSYSIINIDNIERNAKLNNETIWKINNKWEGNPWRYCHGN